MSVLGSNKEVFSIINKLVDDYKSSTPTKLKLVDAYMFCVMLTGIFQFVYCCLVGTFPFNAFLSGFISTVACFVLAASYRIQINKANSSIFGVNSERAFADFIFAHIVLHLVVINFIG